MFTLSLCITASDVDAIKLELTKGLPRVKSSHRCEAIARGFGFRTYATMRDAVCCDQTSAVVANGAGFVSYLADHNFDVASAQFYRAVARSALHGLMERIPNLTIWGIGLGDPRRKADGRWETLQERNETFVRRRAELVSDHNIEPFLASLAFVSRIARTRTIRPKTNSYWLKHIAENYECTYPEGEPLGPLYVANGTLIAAAVHAGFDMHNQVLDSGYRSLNATFNMGHASLDALDCEIRPDSPAAQERREREEMRLRRLRWLGADPDDRLSFES